MLRENAFVRLEAQHKEKSNELLGSCVCDRPVAKSLGAERMERIASLHLHIRQGTYRVSSADLASALMQGMLKKGLLPVC